MNFGSSGNHRDFYKIDEQWRVTIVYRAPIVTNLFITIRDESGKYATDGPLTGWAYRPTPDQPVIAGPFIERVKSPLSKFLDPFGSFTASFLPDTSKRDSSTNTNAVPLMLRETIKPSPER